MRNMVLESLVMEVIIRSSCLTSFINGDALTDRYGAPWNDDCVVVNRYGDWHSEYILLRATQ